MTLRIRLDQKMKNKLLCQNTMTKANDERKHLTGLTVLEGQSP